MLTGSCLCGDIAFEINGPVDQIGHCHCSMCRKFHGAAFATFAVTAPEHFHWRQGEDKAAHFRSSSHGWRNFCPRCGSPCRPAPPGGRSPLIPLGNVAEDPGTRPSVHFFVRSMAPWHTITDDLPQHPEYPPEFGPDAHAVEQPRRTASTAGATGGSCLCGAVSFEYDGEPAAMVNCHCSRCRRAMSAAHATMVMVDHDGFRWLSGEDAIVNYKMPEAKVESTLLPNLRFAGAAASDPDNMQIPAGCLDDEFREHEARANIFTDRRRQVVWNPNLPSFRSTRRLTGLDAASSPPQWPP